MIWLQRLFGLGMAIGIVMAIGLVIGLVLDALPHERERPDEET